MSAIVAYEAPKASFIFTDGAAYDVTGRLTRIKRKVTVSNKVPLAIASRGNAGLGKILVEGLLERIEADGFDKATSMFESELPELMASIDDAGTLFHTQVFIAGLSETHGVRNVFFQIPGSDRWPSDKIHHQPDFFTGLNCDEGLTLDDMGVRPVRDGDVFHEWIRDAGLSMMQFARKNPKPSPYFEGLFSSTGGHVDMTTVTAKGVKVETIHRWNDAVGELIDPTKDRPIAKVIPMMPPAIDGMSRQQRRAMKAQGRKRVA
ncbi:hypothetical protein GTW25_00150 [Aliihoeflea aestuarii]|uniref:hypothetical protein n=1 Tax=Aliihoeflea aestuarii TaxID=453840 RepID=UPI0020939E04|nr:hypothetical protein [Aliihoeflea aestuarii]MCO6389441.1 hypothetical protein [Aliihoeflea aestuarii]